MVRVKGHIWVKRMYLTASLVLCILTIDSLIRQKLGFAVLNWVLAVIGLIFYCKGEGVIFHTKEE